MRILKQTNDEIKILIPHQESTSSCISLFFGLLDKGFLSTKTNIKNSDRFISSNDEEFIFTRPLNNRLNEYFKRSIKKDSRNIDLIIQRITTSSIDVNFDIHLVEDDKFLFFNKKVKKLFNNSTLSYGKVELPDKITCLNSIPIQKYNLTMNDDDFKKYIKKKVTSINNCMSRVSNIENNFTSIFPLIAIELLCFKPTTKKTLSMMNFCKLLDLKYIFESADSSIDKAIKTRFIDICNIFLKNNIINKLKVGSFEFLKTRMSTAMQVVFNGLILVNIQNLNHFLYMNHPGITLCTHIINELKLFEKIETKLSTEIITQI